MIRASFVILALLPSCGSDTVETRACNASDHDFTTLAFDTPNDGPLAAGRCTAYRVATGNVYRYTYVEFTVGTERFRLQPIDFVGETPLAPGLWSYDITIRDFATLQARIWARRDE